MSSTIQNELIACCEAQILETRKLKKQSTSVLADETLDASGIEQLSICIR